MNRFYRLIWHRTVLQRKRSTWRGWDVKRNEIELKLWIVSQEQKKKCATIEKFWQIYSAISNWIESERFIHLQQQFETRMESSALRWHFSPNMRSFRSRDPRLACNLIGTIPFRLCAVVTWARSVHLTNWMSSETIQRVATTQLRISDSMFRVSKRRATPLGRWRKLEQLWRQIKTKQTVNIQTFISI